MCLVIVHILPTDVLNSIQACSCEHRWTSLCGGQGRITPDGAVIGVSDEDGAAGAGAEAARLGQPRVPSRPVGQPSTAAAGDAADGV